MPAWYDNEQEPSVQEMRKLMMQIMQAALRDIQGGSYSTARMRIEHVEQWVAMMKKLSPTAMEATIDEIGRFIREGMK